MKRLFILYLLLCVFFSYGQNITHTMQHDTSQRSYIVHLPPAYNSGVSLPCVFNLHGSGSTAAQHQLYANMDAISNSQGFIVVYPQGLQNTWESGGYTTSYAQSDYDVRFISALIDTLQTRYHIDLNKVYACGLSMGGFMSYRLACSLENRIAAIASVAGALSDSTKHYCSTLRTIPALEIHGTADPIISYQRASNSSIHWATHNQCTANDTIALANTYSSDNSTVDKITWQYCLDGAEVMLMRVNNGGHTWPNSFFNLPGYGNTNKDIKASLEIWNFFKRFTLNGPVSVKEIKKPFNVNIYPNPANSKLQIEPEKAGSYELAVYDLTGQQLIRQTISQSATIDVSFLNPGIYFLELKHEGTIINLKFVKE